MNDNSNQKTDEYYNQIAPSYDELYEKEQEEKITFIKQLITLPEGTLLDVGCGTGISTNAWQRTATGVDPALQLIKLAKKKHPKHQFEVAMAEDLPFKDQEFDIIISLTAIQNFESLEKGLQEIKRAGKDTFILTFLKTVQKAQEIKETITKIWPHTQWYEQKKDMIAIVKTPQE